MANQENQQTKAGDVLCQGQACARKADGKQGRKEVSGGCFLMCALGAAHGGNWESHASIRSHGKREPGEAIDRGLLSSLLQTHRAKGNFSGGLQRSKCSPGGSSALAPTHQEVRYFRNGITQSGLHFMQLYPF